MIALYVMILSSRLNPCSCHGSDVALSEDVINGDDIQQRYFIKPFYQIFNNKLVEEENKGQYPQLWAPHFVYQLLLQLVQLIVMSLLKKMMAMIYLIGLIFSLLRIMMKYQKDKHMKIMFLMI